MGSDGPSNSSSIGGPYEPRISPDGQRFAYSFYVPSTTDDWENDEIHIATVSYGTWIWADHFTSPATESEFSHTFVQPEWVTNDRLLGSVSVVMNLFTWELGTGHGLYDSGGQ